MLAASLIDLVLGLALDSTKPESGNRVALEGLAFGKPKDGAFEIAIRKFEAGSLRIASAGFVLEIGHLVLHEVVARVRMESGQPRPGAVTAARAEFSAVTVHGPLMQAGAPGPGKDHGRPSMQGGWGLGPLAAANGTLRAEIIDAHLHFDANVTIPIRHGQIDFNQVTVEHVGPDSRMGISPAGLYVDAPTGRSYLFEFASPPTAGVEFERRGALLGARVANRGHLQLQAFVEGALRQPNAGPAAGFTRQTRVLFDRTAVSGEVRLSDGAFSVPGMRVDLAGRAEGRNTVRLHSDAVGRGLTVEIPSLSARKGQLSARHAQAACDEIAGALTLRVLRQGPQLRFAFELASMKIAGLRLELQGPLDTPR